MVGGDFITQSSYGPNEADVNYNYFGNGVMKLKGNFAQLSGNAANFAVHGTKVILCGDDDQNVSFSDYGKSGFKTLQLTQPKENYVFHPNPCWESLQSNDISDYQITIEQNYNYTGKEIKVTVQSTQQGRNPRELYPDLTKIVSQAIHMEVEDLEEEPEGFELG